MQTIFTGFFVWPPRQLSIHFDFYFGQSDSIDSDLTKTSDALLKRHNGIADITSDVQKEPARNQKEMRHRMQNIMNGAKLEM